MQRLLFLSITSAALVTGCGDDECGPAGAPQYGLLASSADVTLTYGNLTAGANNDCPDPMAPAGVISMTIMGSQMGGGGILTFCVPRPDLLSGGRQLGSEFRIIDLSGDDANGCMYSLESTRLPTGGAQAMGICDNGKNSAGFALSIDGNISFRRTCPASTDTISVTLNGIVAVTSTD
jgi:hypothetical protein